MYLHSQKGWISRFWSTSFMICLLLLFCLCLVNLLIFSLIVLFWFSEIFDMSGFNILLEIDITVVLNQPIHHFRKCDIQALICLTNDVVGSSSAIAIRLSLSWRQKKMSLLELPHSSASIWVFLCEARAVCKGGLEEMACFSHDLPDLPYSGRNHAPLAIMARYFWNLSVELINCMELSKSSPKSSSTVFFLIGKIY